MRLAPLPMDVPVVSLLHVYVTEGISPSGSLSLDRQVSVFPMATEEESKVSESILGARFPTVAVVVDSDAPPEGSVAVKVHEMTSLGEELVVSMVMLSNVESTAPVVWFSQRYVSVVGSRSDSETMPRQESASSIYGVDGTMVTESMLGSVLMMLRTVSCMVDSESSKTV